jgi:4-amino-4-deoxy-L-arabinose transferase-like glycosyltransferase
MVLVFGMQIVSKRPLIFLLLLGAFLYFANLGGPSIYILDEAKNAGCAREMMDRGDLVVPTFNGELRTDKPPLHYYFMMMSYNVFGVSAWGARFFSAIAGLLLIALIYVQVTRIVNERVAFFSALVMLSSIQLTIQFHLAVPDPYLILCITWCLLSFFRGFHGQPGQLWWMYVAAALGFLTKGPIAIIMTGLVVVVYLIITKQLTLASLKRLKLLPGALLFCAIALPWYLAVGNATHGEWLRGFFIGHNLERYTSTMEGHGAFPLAPFVILLAALLPFSVFIVQAVRLAWRERTEKPLLLFCLVVGLAFGVFFSFSKTVLPSYPAPAIPFLAIVLGYFLYALTQSHAFSKTGLNASLAVHLVIAVALLIGGVIALQQEKELQDLLPMVWIFLPLPLAALFGWYFYQQGKIGPFIYSWSAGWMLVVVLFFYVAYPAIDSKNPVSRSMPELARAYSDRQIVSFHLFNPAYAFNLKKTIEVYHTPGTLDSLAKSPNKIVVITRTQYLDELPKDTPLRIIYRSKDLFESSETVLMAN